MKKTLPVCVFACQNTLFMGCQVLEFSVPLRQLMCKKLWFERIIRQGIERQPDTGVAMLLFAGSYRNRFRINLHEVVKFDAVVRYIVHCEKVLSYERKLPNRAADA